MSNILLLNNDMSYELNLVKKSLTTLRKCYPGFNKWFDSKILPNIKESKRKVFLATSINGFDGAMILKDSDNEKKVCTLFVREEKRLNRLGSDFLRIASEELETYKLPITISSEIKEAFFNASGFNFLTKEVRPDLYKKGTEEYIGYILFHNPDKELKRSG